MIIREEQLEVFSQYMIDRFVERALDHLRGKYSELLAGETDGRLRESIRSALDRLERYAVVYEGDVLKYLEYTVRFGENFEDNQRFPQATEILEQEMDGTAKMLLLSEYMATRERGAGE